MQVRRITTATGYRICAYRATMEPPRPVATRRPAVDEGVPVLTAKGVQTHSSNQLSLNNSVHAAKLHAAIKAKKPLPAPHETK